MDIYFLISILLLLSFVYAFTLALELLLRHDATFPKNVPIVGVRNEVLSRGRASLRQLTNGITTLLEGYRQHAQHGRPFVIYDASAQQELLLPVQHLKWFAEQPDSKLSSHGVRQERHAVRYLHMGADVKLASTTHFIRHISNDRLNRHLEALQGPLQDELRRCIDTVFGKKFDQDEWTEANVYGSLQDVVFPAMCRVFLGQHMDPCVLTAFQRYIMVLGLSTIFVGELPRLLKGLVARLVRVPLAYYRNKTLRILKPLVESQLSQRVTQDDDGSSFIRHCARLSEKSTVGGVGEAAAPEVIAEWIMMLARIRRLILHRHPSNQPPSRSSELSARAASPATTPPRGETTLQGDEDLWHKAATFRKQVQADSAIRESLRLHPILIKGLTKEVVPPAGLQLPDGTHLPAGGWVGVPVLGIHQDERFYPRADLYQPFRFVKEHEATPGRRSCDGQQKPAHARAEACEDGLEAAKPTTTYLGFGYGRHACPGRWFAVVILKMILSYVSINYDIEPTGPPPQTKVLGDAALPPIWATIRIRRRKVPSAPGN